MTRANVSHAAIQPFGPPNASRAMIRTPTPRRCSVGGADLAVSPEHP